MTNKEITLCFAFNLLTLPEDARGFEKYKARTNTQKFRINNPEKDVAARAKFLESHPTYWADRQKKRNKTPEGKQYRREYENNRRATDLQWKIKKSVTTDILQALKRTKGKKHARTAELLGCSIPEFQEKIAKLFKPGMTWGNHGRVWHLDHIRPKRSFDLTDPEQQKACFHFSNWQPLPVFDNQSKGAKWDGKDWRFE